jgi:hypothetical protein
VIVAAAAEDHVAMFAADNSVVAAVAGCGGNQLRPADHDGAVELVSQCNS